ncbi:MAG: response regulator [Mariprofundus sp.]|nr:response regulator [Mariprofundus sp.]
MNLHENSNEVTIILAEDDPGHAKLTEKNLRRAGINNEIQWCENGQLTLDYIQGKGAFSGHSHTKSVILLLDLNMPVLDGYQVLEALKSDESTKRIPIVILTTTDEPREVKRCYDLGCNIYINKPVDYEGFSNAIRQLGLFLNVVQVPNGK